MLGGRNPGLGLAILRITLGLIFLAQGWSKLFGGIEGNAALALLESAGGVLLIVGLFVAPAALLLVAHVLAGIFLGPGQGGIEFNLLLIAGLLTLLLTGSGIATLAGRFQKDIRVM